MNIDYAILSPASYLREMDMKSFIENFRGLLPNKLFSSAVEKLFSLIYTIKYLNDNISKSIDRLSPALQQYQDEYFVNLDSIRKLHDEQALRFQNGEITEDRDKQFVIGLAHIMKNWQETNSSTNVCVTYDLVIKKCMEYFKKFTFLPRAHQMINYALSADKAFLNLKNIEKIYADELILFSFHHKKASKLIKVIIKILY